jgi:predicted nucleic acid-binding protein
VKAVVDASVIVKWVFPPSEAEEDTDQALTLLQGINAGSIILLQPPHWLTEVAAVVTRLHPEVAEPALDLLDAMELPVTSDLAVFKKATQLSLDLNHYLFDTLYHAVAMEHGHTLITADGRYFRKARRLGRIVPLKAWDRVERIEDAERFGS